MRLQNALAQTLLAIIKEHPAANKLADPFRGLIWSRRGCTGFVSVLAKSSDERKRKDGVARPSTCVVARSGD